MDPFSYINAKNTSAYATAFSNFSEDLKSLGKTVQTSIRARMSNRRGDYKTIDASGGAARPTNNGNEAAQDPNDQQLPRGEIVLGTGSFGGRDQQIEKHA